MFYDIFDSPIGVLTVATDGKAVTGLHIEGDRYFTKVPVGWAHSDTHPLLSQVKRELAEYFAGVRIEFGVPVGPEGTSFQLEVWQALQGIAAGQTLTYGELARQLGRPQAARAVGTAVGRNPICIIIPCHRVVAGDGSLGGYVAGLECKQELLVLEQRYAILALGREILQSAH
jgi:methylated-DNA-[protein]-cysteine S-methyltransferase